MGCPLQAWILELVLFDDFFGVHQNVDILGTFVYKGIAQTGPGKLAPEIVQRKVAFLLHPFLNILKKMV